MFGKRGWFSKEVEKVEKVGKKLVDPAVKEFEDVGGEFNHLTDRFLMKLLTEKWKNTSGKKVKDVMEKATKVKASASLKQVIKKLQNTEDVVIVVDDKGKLLGSIDEADLIPLLVPQGKINVSGILGGYKRIYFAKTAKDLMKEHVYFVTPNTEIEKAAFIISKEEVRSLAVVKGRRIVGVVHIRNLVKHIK
jgi:CBS domain-containing protein